jgi:hypothetical protein
MKRCWPIDHCGRWTRALLIPHCYKDLASDAEAQGDLEAVKRYRREAMYWFDQVADVYKYCRTNADKEIHDQQLRLNGYEAEAIAAEAAARGDTAREMQFVNQAYQFWLEVFRGDELGRECARHLKKIAARYEQACKAERDPAKAEDLRERYSSIWLTLLKHRVPDTEVESELGRFCGGYSDLIQQEKGAGQLDLAAKHGQTLSAAALGLYQRQTNDETSAPLVMAAARLLQSLASDLAQAGKKPEADKATLGSSDLWTELLNRKHREDDAAPTLRRGLELYQKAASEGSMPPYPALMKQVDIRMALMAAGIEAQQQEAALKGIAKLCVDNWEQARATGDEQKQSEWYAGGMGLCTYFLQKNPSDAEARAGWDRLNPKGEPEREPAPAPTGYGGTWVVYLFPAGMIGVGLGIAYLLRKRRMRRLRQVTSAGGSIGKRSSQ